MNRRLVKVGQGWQQNEQRSRSDHANNIDQGLVKVGVTGNCGRLGRGTIPTQTNTLKGMVKVGWPVRPTPIQLSQLQAAAHKAIDRIILAQPTITRHAHEMAWGIPSSVGGGHGSGSHTDPTATTALGGEVIDPALPYVEWLATFTETLNALYACADRGAVLAASRAPTGRTNTVDVCAGCGQPAVKVRRIDGEPYCEPCYQAENRRRRGCVTR